MDYKEIKVSVKNTHLVKPSEPTWKGTLSLTEFDQLGTMMHVPTIYFYTPPESWLSFQNALIKRLKDSLSQVLVHFYPLAGRLSWIAGSRVELNCNAGGVLLVEAECDNEMSELGDFSPTPEFTHLIPSVDYTNITEMPLFLGQLTKFKCGGVSLGLAISHVAADGRGLCGFLVEWAHLARGELLSSAPFLDRKVLRAGDPPLRGCPVLDRERYLPAPPLIVGESSNEAERMKDTKACTLRLSKQQIDALKAAANAGANFNQKWRAYSRYEVITTHIWRCASKARKHKPEQPTNLLFCVDIRKRLDFPLPNSYFGNAIIDVVARSTACEITSNPLQHTTRMIRELVDGVTTEYVNSTLNLLKNEENLIKSPPFGGNPNVSVISWMGLPLLGLDFGWGEEIYMGPGTHDHDGDFLVLPNNTEDGSLRVAFCFHVDYIEDFKKYFYEDIKNLCI